MTKLSQVQLERAKYEAMAEIAGEEPSMEKMSVTELGREQVRLLGIIKDNGMGAGGGGTSFAEDYGPTAGRPVEPATGYQYFDTTLMQLLVWNGSDWQAVDTTADATARAALASLNTRQILTHTTTSLAPGASEPFTLTLPRTFTLVTAEVSSNAFTRGYLTTTTRDADATRDPGEVPDDTVFYGLAFDLNLPDRGALSVPIGEDISLGAGGEMYMSIRNMGSSAAAITLTLEYLGREA